MEWKTHTPQTQHNIRQLTHWLLRCVYVTFSLSCWFRSVSVVSVVNAFMRVLLMPFLLICTNTSWNKSDEESAVDEMQNLFMAKLPKWKLEIAERWDKAREQNFWVCWMYQDQITAHLLLINMDECMQSCAHGSIQDMIWESFQTFTYYS